MRWFGGCQVGKTYFVVGAVKDLSEKVIYMQFFVACNFGLFVIYS